MARETFEGMDDFMVRLKRLKSVAKKIGTKCVIAGMDEAIEVLKANAPQKYEGGIKAYGRRIERSLTSDEIITGIYGIGVGKRRLHVSRTHTVSGGVGIHANNIHWFILGTKERHTREGYNRGAMPPQVPGFFRNGMPHAEKRALAAMARTYKAEVAKFNDE